MTENISFNENVRFPDSLSYWAKGGYEFKTNVVVLNNGKEQRNALWLEPKSFFTISNANRLNIVNKDDLYEYKLSINFLINFHYEMMGKLIGFRFKNFQDYLVSLSEGCFDKSNNPTGKKEYQLYKKYFLYDIEIGRFKKIVKPVENDLVIYKNNSLLIENTNYNIDYTSGIVSFIPDKTLTISTITTNTNPTITTVQDHGLSVNEYVYLNNILNGNLLNKSVVKILSIIDSKKFTIDTENLSNINSGTVELYPQPSDVISWSGEFDLPCRFGDDKINYFVDGGLISLDTITIEEIKL